MKGGDKNGRPDSPYPAAQLTALKQRSRQRQQQQEAWQQVQVVLRLGQQHGSVPTGQQRRAKTGPAARRRQKQLQQRQQLLRHHKLFKLHNAPSLRSPQMQEQQKRRRWQLQQQQQKDRYQHHVSTDWQSPAADAVAHVSKKQHKAQGKQRQRQQRQAASGDSDQLLDFYPYPPGAAAGPDTFAVKGTQQQQQQEQRPKQKQPFQPQSQQQGGMHGSQGFGVQLQTQPAAAGAADVGHKQKKPKLQQQQQADLVQPGTVTAATAAAAGGGKKNKLKLQQQLCVQQQQQQTRIRASPGMAAYSSVAAVAAAGRASKLKQQQGFGRQSQQQEGAGKGAHSNPAPAAAGAAAQAVVQAGRKRTKAKRQLQQRQSLAEARQARQLDVLASFAAADAAGAVDAAEAAAASNADAEAAAAATHAAAAAVCTERRQAKRKRRQVPAQEPRLGEESVAATAAARAGSTDRRIKRQKQQQQQQQQTETKKQPQLQQQQTQTQPPTPDPDDVPAAVAAKEQQKSTRQQQQSLQLQLHPALEDMQQQQQQQQQQVQEAAAVPKPSLDNLQQQEPRVQTSQQRQQQVSPEPDATPAAPEHTLDTIQQQQQQQQLDPLVAEQMQQFVKQLLKQQQQPGVSVTAQQQVEWLAGKLVQFQHQLQQQRPLTASECERVLQAARALAADLDAGDKAGLLRQLRYILDVVQCVPRHRTGDLNYCTGCKHDLEDALLVYFLSGADGSAHHKLCRSCFITAIGGWLRQQSGQMGRDFNTFLAGMNSKLSCQQMQQLANWVNAAFDLSSGGTSGSSGVFVLPSPRHTRLLEGRRLSEGLDWPLEYCSLQGGLVQVRALRELVQQLPDFTVTPYSQLAEVRPCLAADLVSLSSKGPATLTHQALEVLLTLMQPRQLTDITQLKPGTAVSKAISDILVTVGVQHKRKGSKQGKAASGAAVVATTAAAPAGTAAAAAGSNDGSSGSSSGLHEELPYYNFNPIDNQWAEGQLRNDYRVVPASVAAADAAVNQLLGSIWDRTRPTQYQAAVMKVLRKHAQQLQAAAAAARTAGDGPKAAACKFMAAVLQIRFSASSGDIAVHDLLTQALLLLGAKGTGTRGHLDPAAALTYAFGLIKPGGQGFDPSITLATWLFVSPEVFTSLALLCKLLWVLQHLLLAREVAAAQQQLVAVMEAAESSKPLRSKDPAKAVQDAEQKLTEAHASLAAFEERWQQQKQQWEQQGQAPAAAAAAAAADGLTDEEQQWLTTLFEYNTLNPQEMSAVQQELGQQYAIVLQQRAGQGVSVPVGWMHWVFNNTPCVKIAWEVVRPQHIPLAVQMQRRLRCKAHGLANDYLGLVPHAVRELLRWRQFM